MDLDTAIVCVANGEIGIRAETKEEAEVIIECAQHWSESSSFEVDSDLTDIPEQWPVFGLSGHMLTCRFFCSGRPVVRRLWHGFGNRYPANTPRRVLS